MIPPLLLRSRLLALRCWHPGDAPLLKHALEVSWSELQAWIPWVFAEPESIGELEDRLRGYREDFLAGGNALYAVMDPDQSEVWGGAGLYRRVGPGALEVGYWVRSDQTGRGVATEASALLTRAGLALDGVERIEIHCDPAHGASAAIPRKLGYRHRETLHGEVSASSGEVSDTMIWEWVAGQSG